MEHTFNVMIISVVFHLNKYRFYLYIFLYRFFFMYCIRIYLTFVYSCHDGRDGGKTQSNN